VDSDCAAGNACTAQSCAPRAPQCSTDLSTATAATGETTKCYPVLCVPSRGQCGETCQAAADCASPFVCDTQGHCVSAPSSASSSGGCSVGPRRTANGHALGALALTALALCMGVRRRRTASGTAVAAPLCSTPHEPGPRV
jgi:hypothetical protein